MHERPKPGVMASRSDEQLLLLLREKGDRWREALAVLFERYHARVLLSCERILGPGPAAEDAMQDIFLSLIEKAQRYENRRSFGAWLFVVTRNHCLNALRRRRREVDMDPYEDFVHEASPAPGPAEDAADYELGERIRQACEERLSPMERRVVDLRLKWGLSVKDIDNLLDLTNASGARTYLSTAKRKLRAALAEFFPPSTRGGGS